jgi:pimeloyl-ACP methyl ester carboxylesterase
VLPECELGKAGVIGHSLGSVIARHHAGMYSNFDFAVLTGILPVIYLRGSEPLRDADPRVMEQFESAAADARFREEKWAQDYLVTRVGWRETLFYWTANAESAVIQHDESSKSTATLGELNSGGSPPRPDVAGPPSVYVVGQYDALLYDANSDADISGTVCMMREAFPGVEIVIIPNAGHDLNLHLNAQQTFATFAELVEGLSG